MNRHHITIALALIFLNLSFAWFVYELVGLHLDIRRQAPSMLLNTDMWVGMMSAIGLSSTIFIALYFANVLSYKRATKWGWIVFCVVLVISATVGFAGMKSAQYRLDQAGYIACLNPKGQPGGFMKWASSLIYEKSPCIERNQQPL